jgi:hypothetical protein
MEKEGDGVPIAIGRKRWGDREMGRGSFSFANC